MRRVNDSCHRLMGFVLKSSKLNQHGMTNCECVSPHVFSFCSTDSAGMVLHGLCCLIYVSVQAVRNLEVRTASGTEILVSSEASHLVPSNSTLCRLGVVMTFAQLHLNNNNNKLLVLNNIHSV